MGAKKICHFLSGSLLWLLAFSCVEVGDQDNLEIIRAHNALTEKNCQEAIDILNAADDQASNVMWHQAMAAAQACQGEFSEITFFAKDVRGIKASQLAEVGNSLASFSTSSSMTAVDDPHFTFLRDAVNTLAMAGNASYPRYEDRGKVWNEEENNNLTLQLSYMTVTALGMYMSYYGNVDAAQNGHKGSGNSGNDCYLKYTDVFAAALITSTEPSITPCQASSDGHPELVSLATAAQKTRACEGVVLLNTLLDSLEPIPLPDDSGEFGNIDNTLNNVVETCRSKSNLDEKDKPICTTTLQSECEAVDARLIQLYFAIFFENIHRDV